MIQELIYEFTVQVSILDQVAHNQDEPRRQFELVSWQDLQR